MESTSTSTGLCMRCPGPAWGRGGLRQRQSVTCCMRCMQCSAGWWWTVGPASGAATSGSQSRCMQCSAVQLGHHRQSEHTPTRSHVVPGVLRSSFVSGAVCMARGDKVQRGTMHLIRRVVVHSEPWDQLLVAQTVVCTTLVDLKRASSNMVTGQRQHTSSHAT